ncbi:MAG: hypothetical protein HQL82_08490 [Magnetococcales bacterium]|nr:hypothetical protein [Magnetococcales bacterium]
MELSFSATVLITRDHPLPRWPTAIPPQLLGERVGLFFAGAGTRSALTLPEPPPPWSHAPRVVCARAYQDCHGVPPAPPLEAAGLAALGGMIRASRCVLCLPLVCLSLVEAAPGPKDIAIRVLDPPASPATLEALRLAVGLAGCGHRVTVYLKTAPPGNHWLAVLPPAAAPFLELFDPLGISVAQDPPGDRHGVILQP